MATTETELDLKELDTAIAERVMQWSGFTCNGRIGYPPAADPHHVLPSVVPDYSTDIAAAMQVVDKVAVHEWRAHLGRGSISPLWKVELFQTNGNMIRREASESDSLPEAICRAALDAINQESKS